jgi:hypothetical protein
MEIQEKKKSWRVERENFVCRSFCKLKHEAPRTWPETFATRFLSYSTQKHWRVGATRVLSSPSLFYNHVIPLFFTLCAIFVSVLLFLFGSCCLFWFILCSCMTLWKFIIIIIVHKLFDKMLQLLCLEKKKNNVLVCCDFLDIIGTKVHHNKLWGCYNHNFWFSHFRGSKFILVVL